MVNWHTQSCSIWGSVCQWTGPQWVPTQIQQPEETTIMPKRFPHLLWPQTPGHPINPPILRILYLYQMMFPSRVPLPCHGTREGCPLLRRLRLVLIALMNLRSWSTGQIHGKELLGGSSGSWILWAQLQECVWYSFHLSSTDPSPVLSLIWWHRWCIVCFQWSLRCTSFHHCLDDVVDFDARNSQISINVMTKSNPSSRACMTHLILHAMKKLWNLWCPSPNRLKYLPSCCRTSVVAVTLSNRTQRTQDSVHHFHLLHWLIQTWNLQWYRCWRI